jgi:DNA-binding transcriptional LysR family regulator
MARRFDLLSLQLFVSVCEARSIARAAEVESIAASAISKHIAQMEELAGTALVVRNRSGVAPTKARLILLEHARNVLLSLDLIERDLASDHRVSRGFLRVYASASAIGEFLASDIVSRYSEASSDRRAIGRVDHQRHRCGRTRRSRSNWRLLGRCRHVGSRMGS